MKKTIPQIYKFGVEITKPWSNKMYQFNEELKAYYIEEISELIGSLETEEACKHVAKIVNPYGYGQGYDVEAMKKDMLKNVENAELYWIKEMVEEFLKEDKYFITPLLFVPADENAITAIDDGKIMNIIGFESKEEIQELRNTFA